MYKTVRHGENSLQYKILAQQEEGVTNVKCRKSKRGRTAGIITIILLLVCGVIASAVLVPLILTNDFITLTGTFQKFSVSTLRRTHSGNHVVVIAKKPHGWNVSRQSVLPPNGQTLNASLSHSADKGKEIQTGRESVINTSNTLNIIAKTQKLENDPKTTTLRQSITNLGDDVFKIEFGAPTTSTDIHDIHPLSASQFQGNALPQTTLTEKVVSTTEVPSWHQRRRWMVESPASFMIWSKNTVLEHPLSTVLVAFFIISFIIIVIVLLMRKIPKRRNIIKDELVDLKDDKTRLLKPSTRGSDEE